MSPLARVPDRLVPHAPVTGDPDHQRPSLHIEESGVLAGIRKRARIELAKDPVAVSRYQVVSRIAYGTRQPTEKHAKDAPPTAQLMQNENRGI